MTPKHTPTPWHRNVSPAWKYPIYADKNGDQNGRDWIHIGAVLSGNPNAEADLDFIVCAVNAHDELLKMVKMAKDLCDKEGYPNFAKDLEKVIAKAEGK